MSKIILGALKIVGLPELESFDTMEEFIRHLPEILRVEIEDSSLSNVIISNQQPGADDKGSLWIRRANSTEILGLYLYSTDRWIQIFPAPAQIFVLTGISTNPPVGYKALEAGDNGLTSDQVAAVYAKVGIEIDSTDVYWMYPAIFLGI